MKELRVAVDQFLGIIKSQKRLRIVHSGSDVKRVSKETQVVLGLQNTVRDINLVELYDLGVRVVGIAYQDSNSFGGGFANQEFSLTNRGKRLIEDCAKIGMILDLSHSNWSTAIDALDFIREEALQVGTMASHGGCWEVYNHKRNFSTRILQSIAEVNGYIGVASLTFILSSVSSLPSIFARHLNYVIRNCGSNSVGIGGDGVFAFQDPIAWEAEFSQLKSKLDGTNDFGARWPDQPFKFNTPKRMDVIRRLIRKSNLLIEEQNGILGENFMRFLQNNLP
jgi:microsomal dipeptidase-like Zn-dependent dipeptidase